VSKWEISRRFRENTSPFLQKFVIGRFDASDESAVSFSDAWSGLKSFVDVSITTATNDTIRTIRTKKEKKERNTQGEETYFLVVDHGEST